jgi:hypothetical protein
VLLPFFFEGKLGVWNFSMNTGDFFWMKLKIVHGIYAGILELDMKNIYFFHVSFAPIMSRMIYFTYIYNILTPTNITNIFGNLLNGINEMDKTCINIGVPFYVSPYGHAEIILFLIIKRLLFFAGYSASCALHWIQYKLGHYRSGPINGSLWVLHATGC